MVVVFGRKGLFAQVTGILVTELKSRELYIESSSSWHPRIGLAMKTLEAG